MTKFVPFLLFNRSVFTGIKRGCGESPRRSLKEKHLAIRNINILHTLIYINSVALLRWCLKMFMLRDPAVKSKCFRGDLKTHLFAGHLRHERIRGVTVSRNSVIQIDIYWLTDSQADWLTYLFTYYLTWGFVPLFFCATLYIIAARNEETAGDVVIVRIGMRRHASFTGPTFATWPRRRLIRCSATTPRSCSLARRLSRSWSSSKAASDRAPSSPSPGTALTTRRRSRRPTSVSLTPTDGPRAHTANDDEAAAACRAYSRQGGPKTQTATG